MENHTMHFMPTSISTLPCKDCITLAICRSIYKESLPMNRMSKLFTKCDLLHKHIYTTHMNTDMNEIIMNAHNYLLKGKLPDE